MSAYTLYSKDLEEILKGDCFNQNSNNHESLKNNDIISGKYGSFNIKNSNYNNVYIGENKYRLTEDTKLYADVEGEMIGFAIVNYGYSSFSCSSVKESNLVSNTMNMFYVNNEVNSLTKYKKNIRGNNIDILISRNLFDNMLNRHTEILGHIGEKINQKHSFALYENGRPIDSRILEVLSHIKTANLLGNAAPMFVEAKTLELFALLSCNDDNCKKQEITCTLRDKMLEAKYIIEKQYNNPPSLNELAKHLGICNTTLKECFKNVFNNTVFGYLFEYRMKKAEELLINNLELSIFEIAQKLGYEHQTNFGVAFKRKYGVTPLEFRNRS
ncbi:MAG: AraC family transcriptional regulator [Ignavibacteria bacterium]|jgi:AraC-like DNA-binding protein